MKRASLSVLLATTLLGMPASANDAEVPDFDPDEPIVVELAKFGKEKPNPRELEGIFEQQYPVLDACVSEEKERTESTRQLLGDAFAAVRLDPNGGTPTAAHARLPREHATRGLLIKCIRKAAVAAPWPAYDGPPAVASFTFELDPGSDYVECEPDDDDPACEPTT